MSESQEKDKAESKNNKSSLKNDEKLSKVLQSPDFCLSKIAEGMMQEHPFTYKMMSLMEAKIKDDQTVEKVEADLAGEIEFEADFLTIDSFHDLKAAESEEDLDEEVLEQINSEMIEKIKTIHDEINTVLKKRLEGENTEVEEQWRKKVVQYGSHAKSDQEKAVVDLGLERSSDNWQSELTKARNKYNEEGEEELEEYLEEEDPGWQVRLGAYLEKTANGNKPVLCIENELPISGAKGKQVIEAVKEILDFMYDDYQATLLQSQADFMFSKKRANFSKDNDEELEDFEVNTALGGTNFQDVAELVQDKLDGNRPLINLAYFPRHGPEPPEEMPTNTFWLLTRFINKNKRKNLTLPGDVGGMKKAPYQKDVDV